MPKAYDQETFAVAYGRYQYRRDRATEILRRETRPELSWRGFLATLRQGPFAWPGGYQISLLTSGGDTLCFNCASENSALIARAIRDRDRSGWAVVAAFVHWEGPPEFCAHCGAEIASEYGDPDDPED